MANKQEATHTATIKSFNKYGNKRCLAEHVIGVVIDGGLIRAVDIPPRKGAPQLLYRQPSAYAWHKNTGLRTMHCKRQSWQELDLSTLLPV